jgi:superfamily II DNA or RNA helicase
MENKEGWKEWLKTIDFVIVDEAHRGEHDKILEALRNDVFVIGLSGTVYRSGSMKQLGLFYDCIVKTVECSDIIPLGYLTKSRNFTFQAPKLDDLTVSYSSGDYVQKELQKRFQKPERYAGIIENYQNLVPNTKAIVFTTGVEHCVELCKAFNEAGIKAKYLVSESLPETDFMYSGRQDDILSRFSNREFDVLLNISILDTGF